MQPLCVTISFLMTSPERLPCLTSKIFNAGLYVQHHDTFVQLVAGIYGCDVASRGNGVERFVALHFLRSD